MLTWSHLGMLNVRGPVLDLCMRQALRFKCSFELALRCHVRCTAGVQFLHNIHRIHARGPNY